MTGMPHEILPSRRAFGKNCDRPLTRLSRVPEPGRATATARDATSSRDIPSAWCTSFAATTSRSWGWHTGVGGRATGKRASDAPSNFRMQRAALSVAADPGRWTDRN